MKKKIGFVNFDMSTRGGAQQVLQNLSNVLAREDEEYEIYIISLIHEKSACAYPLEKGIHYENILPYKGRIRDVILKAGKKFRRFFVLCRRLCWSVWRPAWTEIEDTKGVL